MANELKPCPFCQRQPIVSENNVPGNWYAVAECDNSKCSERPLIYGDDVTDAKAKWNNGEAWNARRAAPVECHPRDTNSVEYHEPRNVAVKPVDGLVRYDISMFGNGAVEMGGGEYVRFDQAEAIIAAKDREISELKEDRKQADLALVDKYRDPKYGHFVFPDDVAAIIRKLEALETKLATAWKALELIDKAVSEGRFIRIRKIARAALEAKP